MRKLSWVLKLSVIGLAWWGLATSIAAQPRCNFTAPQGWVAGSTRWDGECKAGQADGLGVLKEYSGASVKRIYFGRLKNGSPDLGVVDQPDGYVAGQFADGKPLVSDDRQVFVSAFAEAEKAAKQTAGRLAKAGNKASAAFYQNKARALREQMD